MKKFILIILSLGSSIAFAQNGNYGYNGGNPSPDPYTNPTNDTPPVYSNGGDYGTNAYYGPNPNVNGGNCAPNQGTRIRWEASPCGTFNWRIEEISFWVPGQWSYYNGCRTWVDGYMGWTPTCRSRVYQSHNCYNGCGHPVGTYYYTNGAWCNSPRPYGGTGGYPYGGYGNNNVGCNNSYGGGTYGNGGYGHHYGNGGYGHHGHR